MRFYKGLMFRGILLVLGLFLVMETAFFTLVGPRYYLESRREKKEPFLNTGPNGSKADDFITYPLISIPLGHTEDLKVYDMVQNFRKELIYQKLTSKRTLERYPAVIESTETKASFRPRHFAVGQALKVSSYLLVRSIVDAANESASTGRTDRVERIIQALDSRDEIEFLKLLVRSSEENSPK